MESLLWKEIWKGDIYAFYAYVSHETLPNYHIFKKTPTGYEEYFHDQMDQGAKDTLPIKVPWALHMNRTTGKLYMNGRTELTEDDTQLIQSYIQQRYHVENPTELRHLLNKSDIPDENIEALVTTAGIHYGFLTEEGIPMIHAYDKLGSGQWQEYPVPQELLPIVLQAYAEEVEKSSDIKQYVVDDNEVLMIGPVSMIKEDVPEKVREGLIYVVIKADEEAVHAKEGSWLSYEDGHYLLPTQDDMYDEVLVTSMKEALEKLIDVGLGIDNEEE